MRANEQCEPVSASAHEQSAEDGEDNALVQSTATGDRLLRATWISALVSGHSGPLPFRRLERG